MIKNETKFTKVVLCGDIHFGVYSNSHEWLNITKDFFYRLFIPFLEYLKEDKQYDDVLVVFVGDINDKKQNINSLIQNEQIYLFEQIAKIYPTCIFIGNHDTPFKGKVNVGSGDEKKHVNSCKSLHLIDNVEVFENPKLLDIDTGDKLLLIPYQNNPKDELDIIKRYSKKVGEGSDLYGFGHTEIAGFHYEGVPVDESKHNKIDDFKPFKKFWSGHIHKRQSKENIQFTGTPYQLKRQEAGNENGFTYIDFKNDIEKWIENDISPKFKTIPLGKLMNMKVSEANKFVENNFVDVIFPGILSYSVNFKNITDVLSGYRSMDPKNSKNSNAKDLTELIGESGLEEVEKVDVGSKIPRYVENLDKVKVGKNYMVVNDKMRNRLKDTLKKLYKAAENRVSTEDFELNED